MTRRSWTNEDLEAAVAASRSIRQVFLHLGLKVRGGAHALLKRRIVELGLDTSHFRGQGWNKGDPEGVLARARPKLELDEILVEDSTYQSTYKLKARLLEAGLLQNRCYLCGLAPEWCGAPLVHRLDHINGRRLDNRLENLRLLCPNCDSQTPTFAGRNMASARRRRLAQEAEGRAVSQGESRSKS